MPSKKKKYNARFPAGRIKKIMQTDEEVGKVAQAVPVIISRTLELFVGSLLNKAMQITSAKNAKTLSPSHMKQCILSEQRFDFLKDLVKMVQDTSNGEDDSVPAAPGTHRSTVTQRRRSSTTVKEEPVTRHEPVLKLEPVVKEENTVDYGDGSMGLLKPNFYTETEPLLSSHVPSPPSILPSYSPELVMDEDYDT